MEKILLAEEYRALPKEVKKEVHNPHSKPFSVEVCNNCGVLVANSFRDNKRELPDEVSHSVTHLEGSLSLEMILCVSCNSKMLNDMAYIRRKYKEGKGRK